MEQGLPQRNSKDHRGGGGEELGGEDDKGSRCLKLEYCALCISQRDGLFLSFSCNLQHCTVHGQGTECFA